MKILIYGLVGLIFLELFIGGARALGESGAEGAVSSDVRMPYARVLPGHPFYVLKELGRDAREFLSFGVLAKARAHMQSSRERLAELYGLLQGGGASEKIREAEEAYAENLKTLAKLGAVSEKKADAIFSELLETGFYETRVLSRMREQFPKSAEMLSQLEEGVFAALGEVLDFTSFHASFESAEFEKSPLPAIGFFERVLQSVHTPEVMARVLLFEEKLLSHFRGKYLAGKFRAGAILNYFSEQQGDAFSTLRTLDVLQSAFRDDELGNQLQFLRQEFLKNPRVSSELSMERADREIQKLGETLRVFSEYEDIPAHLRPKLSDAKFTYDRALEFYSSGFFDRTLSQVSLSLSSLYGFISNYFLSEELAKEEAYALRERFDAFKKDFFDGKKFGSRADYLFKDAEKDIAELLVEVGKNEVPSFSLFSRVRSFLVALETMLQK